jgi:hypothetical protein
MIYFASDRGQTLETFSGRNEQRGRSTADGIDDHGGFAGAGAPTLCARCHCDFRIQQDCRLFRRYRYTRCGHVGPVQSVAENGNPAGDLAKCIAFCAAVPPAGHANLDGPCRPALYLVVSLVGEHALSGEAAPPLVFLPAKGQQT